MIQQESYFNDEHDYVYQFKPLLLPAVMFLILYPLIIGGIHFISKLPIIELRILIGIYITTALGVIFLCVLGKSKHVQINDQHIIFYSLLGKHILEPQIIRRVTFYSDRKGQELAQIRTEDKLYYVSEFYFPFPELMSDLENFIEKYNLRSYVKNYTGLIY